MSCAELPEEKIWICVKIGRQRRKLMPSNSKKFIEIEGKVSSLKLAVRIIGFCLVVALAVSLIMSDITLSHGGRPHPFQGMLLYVVLLIFICTILIPTIFEVRQIKVTALGLELSTIFWRSNLAWQDIVAFRHPDYLKIAMIKTRKCIYLINKRDLSNYEELEKRLSEGAKLNLAR